MRDEQPYNPLDKRNLGESVAEALLARPIEPLPPAATFSGAGVYAIYYTGPYPAYEPLSALNRQDRYRLPIYVGKAVPSGARKGLESDPGPSLFKRLSEHARSIAEVPNLHLPDFRCRYLVVDEIWIPLGETLLIRRFSPIWNRVIDGFGNHAPGGGRVGQKQSPWDLLHPGRAWATKLPAHTKNEEEFIRLVANHVAEVLATLPPE